jgi:hypothetical protein
MRHRQPPCCAASPSRFSKKIMLSRRRAVSLRLRLDVVRVSMRCQSFGLQNLTPHSTSGASGCGEPAGKAAQNPFTLNKSITSNTRFGFLAWRDRAAGAYPAFGRSMQFRTLPTEQWWMAGLNSSPLENGKWRPIRASPNPSSWPDRCGDDRPGAGRVPMLGTPGVPVCVRSQLGKSWASLAPAATMPTVRSSLIAIPSWVAAGDHFNVRPTRFEPRFDRRGR